MSEIQGLNDYLQQYSTILDSGPTHLCVQWPKGNISENLVVWVTPNKEGTLVVAEAWVDLPIKNLGPNMALYMVNRLNQAKVSKFKFFLSVVGKICVRGHAFYPTNEFRPVFAHGLLDELVEEIKWINGNYMKADFEWTAAAV